MMTQDKQMAARRAVVKFGLAQIPTEGLERILKHEGRMCLSGAVMDDDKVG